MEDNIGLFGYTDSTAIVDSLSLVGYSVKGKNSIGGLVGYNSGSVSGSYSNGFVSGHDFIGGLVGGSTGIVSNSYSSGTVTGRDYVGGLVGGSTGVLNNSYSTSAVKGLNQYSGGLLGLQMNGTVNNCYSIGSVTGKFVVGGLVGYNVNAEVSNSYSTGSVTGTKYVGGLVGYNDDTVTGCYWDVESSGTATGIGKDDNSQSVTGLTTAKMKQKNSFVGWDFSTIWSIKEGVSYPQLRVFEDESQSISPYLAINTGSLKPVAGGVEVLGVRGRLDLYNISGARLTTLNVTSDGFYPLQQQPGLYILRGAGQSWKVLQK